MTTIKFRFTQVFILFLGVLILFSGCASSKKTVEQASQYWSTDIYVSGSDNFSRAENLARIIEREPGEVNVVMQVGVFKLPVHEKPSVDSKVLGTLSIYDAVSVVEWSRFYRVPSTSLMQSV